MSIAFSFTFSPCSLQAVQPAIAASMLLLSCLLLFSSSFCSVCGWKEKEWSNLAREKRVCKCRTDSVALTSLDLCLQFCVIIIVVDVVIVFVVLNCVLSRISFAPVREDYLFKVVLIGDAGVGYVVQF